MQNRLSKARRHRMIVLIPRLAVAVICAWSSTVHAQDPAQPVPADERSAPQKLNRDELSQILAPIALYPDALIAIILPASTVPADLVLAARYLAANGDPALTKNQPWDESVISLVRYPQVLAWMDKNLEWTASLGEAFVEQPADVMNALQSLRAQAKAAGHLQDTPQQIVVADGNLLRIVPADPQVIYVPQYDADLVYVQTDSSAPLLTFGIGYAVGPWLCYDCDWQRRHIYRGYWHGWAPRGSERHEHFDNEGPGRLNVVNIDVNNAIPWQPSSGSQHQIAQRQRNNNGNARFVNARNGAIGTVGAVSAPLQVIQQPTAQPVIQPTSYVPRQQTALPRPTHSQISTTSSPLNEQQQERGRSHISQAPQVQPTEAALENQAQAPARNHQSSHNSRIEANPTSQPPTPVVTPVIQQHHQQVQEPIQIQQEHRQQPKAVVEATKVETKSQPTGDQHEKIAKKKPEEKKSE